MERLNMSFDSYLNKTRKIKTPAKNMSNSFFAAGSNLDTSMRKRPKTPNMLQKFPPTRTLAEYNMVRYADPTKNTPIPNLN
mmetsp:Transcript_27963/g.24642  ORF Transcript_27963/g.24642 Transcript_27963/m.24642 type:complete len:81 (+) Transcript_27963:57-299(+)